jgi:hypothetical protein
LNGSDSGDDALSSRSELEIHLICFDVAIAIPGPAVTSYNTIAETKAVVEA